MKLAEQHQERLEQQCYLALLSRFPKHYEGKDNPITFFNNLEKQLSENEISQRRWQEALQNSLRGEALHAYMNVLTPHEKSSCDLAKMALSQFLGASVPARINHAAMVKVKLSDSIQDMIAESVKHVRAFTKSTDTAAEIELKWMMVHTLAKCTRECADKVWSNQQTTPAQLAQ